MPTTITVDLSGGPHGPVTLPDIPLLDDAPPEYIEYRGVVYRLLAPVQGRVRRLYHMHTVATLPKPPEKKPEKKTPRKKPPVRSKFVAPA